MIKPPLALTPGTRLGPYEVVPHVGAVGMAEACCAWGTKLNRDVVIRVVSLALGCLALMHPAHAIAQVRAPEAPGHVRTSVTAQVRFGTPHLGPRTVDALIESQSGSNAGQATNKGRTWFGRHPVLAGALLGAAGGATLGATGGTEPGTSKAATVAFTAAVGAGVGALIGRAFR
jgi:hypothetical protein